MNVGSVLAAIQHDSFHVPVHPRSRIIGGLAFDQELLDKTEGKHRKTGLRPVFRHDRKDGHSQATKGFPKIFPTYANHLNTLQSLLAFVSVIML